MFPRALRAFVLASIGIAASARADEVVLKNGDRLSGKVVTLADGSLTLETQFSGTVKIS